MLLICSATTAGLQHHEEEAQAARGLHGEGSALENQKMSGIFAGWLGNPTINNTFAFFIFIFILKLSKWSGWSTTKFQHMEIATSHVAPYHRKLLRPRGGGLLQINGSLGERTRSTSLSDT